MFIVLILLFNWMQLNIFRGAMVVATITSNGAFAAERQIEPCGLSNQRASWVTATIGPSTKFEAVASASTQSSGLSSESVMRIALSLARMS